MTRVEALIGVIGGLVVALWLLAASYADRLREEAIERAQRAQHVRECEDDQGVALVLRRQDGTDETMCGYGPGRFGQRRY